MVYSGFWKRFNAYGIDSLIVLVLCLIAGMFVGSASAQSPDDLQALVDSGLLNTTDPQQLLKQLMAGNGGSWFSWDDFLLPLLVSAAYNIFFVAGKWQATPGKHWLKIKVVMVDGGKLSLLESTFRHIVSGVSMWPLGLGYIPIFFTREKLALHDIICNTRVVMR